MHKQKNVTLYQEEGLQGHDNTTKEKERIEKRRKVCIIEHVAPSSGQVRALMLIRKQSNYLVMYVESKCFLSLYLNVMNLGDSFKQLSKLFQSLGPV